MAKANQITESSMEEILASIRKIITEDDFKPAEDAVTAEEVTGTEAPPSNVSPLFKADAPQDGKSNEPPRTEDASDSAFLTPTPMAEAATTEEAAVDSLPALADDRDETAQPAANALLSPQTDRAVATAFNQLANTILANNSRTIEQLAEDMMRPMLKSWLDDNLPTLVERLVREEIERVSRRR